MKSPTDSSNHQPVSTPALAPDGNEKPFVIWLTGLSGSGKSTLALDLKGKLTSAARRVYVLDGDDLRTSLCSDLGFSTEDRTENIRRACEVARILLEAGITVIAAFISPLKAQRSYARSLLYQNNFTEIYCNASFKDCELRDPKNLYKKARSGHIKNFTGIQAEYEIPENPEIIVDTIGLNIQQSSAAILDTLRQRGIIIHEK